MTRLMTSSAACCGRSRRVSCSSSSGSLVALSLAAGSHVDRSTGATVNNFLNSYTLIQTATDASFFAIMAVGATIVIISGGIDLSVGVDLRAGRRHDGDGPARAGPDRPRGDRAARPRASASASASLCGALNGVMVVGLGVHPFIITLGTMWILRGIAFVTSKAESILVPDVADRRRQGVARPGAALYPVPMLAMLAVAVARRGLSRRARSWGGTSSRRRQRRGQPLLRPARSAASRSASSCSSGLTAGLAASWARASTARPRVATRPDTSCTSSPRRSSAARSLTRRQGERRQRDARRAADRAHPAVDPDAALRSELRVDHHRLRHHRRGRARPGAARGSPRAGWRRRATTPTRRRRRGAMTRRMSRILAPLASPRLRAAGACAARRRAGATPRRRRAPAGKPLKIAMIAKSSTNPVFLSARTRRRGRGAGSCRRKHRRPGRDRLADAAERGRPDPGAAHRRRRSTKAANAILISCSDAGKVTGAIDDAVARGVPVMTFDSDAPESKRFAFYGVDDVAHRRSR